MAEESTVKEEEFFTSIKSFGGISRPNRFEVDIFSAGDPGASNNLSADDKYVSLRCQSIDLPGRNMETSPNENVYGPVYEVVRGLTLAGTMSATFLLDENLNIKRYFDNWQKEMYDVETYDIKYYVSYARDMTIKQLSGRNEVVFSCNVLEVYPKTIELIGLNHNSRSEASVLSVTLAYRDWEEIP